MTALLVTSIVVACSGFQSALDPKGPKAEAISHLNWFLVVTSAVVYVVVIGALLFALRRATTRPVAFVETDAEEPERERTRIRWVAIASGATALVLLLFIVVDVSTARSLSRVGGLRPLRRFPGVEPEPDRRLPQRFAAPIGGRIASAVTAA